MHASFFSLLMTGPLIWPLQAEASWSSDQHHRCVCDCSPRWCSMPLRSAEQSCCTDCRSQEEVAAQHNSSVETRVHIGAIYWNKSVQSLWKPNTEMFPHRGKISSLCVKIYEFTINKCSFFVIFDRVDGRFSDALIKLTLLTFHQYRVSFLRFFIKCSLHKWAEITCGWAGGYVLI